MTTNRDTARALSELAKLDDRTRTIFRQIVDSYLTMSCPTLSISG
jgi:hypothetical protein